LEQLSLDELRAMLKFRWQVASGGASHPFTEEAVSAIFHHSAGMPREANILADNALLAAFYQQARVIDADHINAVASDRQENLSRKEAA
jgi:type II secretory pathway predicted ATPase ExeA